MIYIKFCTNKLISNKFVVTQSKINYLQNMLGVAKSGEVPIDLIIKVHYKLGITYFKQKKFHESLNHFNIILNFLKNEEISFNKDEFLGLANLYIGLILLGQKNNDESKIYFKNAFLIGNDNLKVKMKYFNQYIRIYRINM